MWLIDTKTLKLKHFTDPSEVRYAILSHTWTDDAVSFQDMQNLDVARTKSGFSKIEATCRVALEQNLHYAWVDLCCIDKSSSAELSEAINSMFRWYQGAVQCIAYLGDLASADVSSMERDNLVTNVRDCRWFKRGWTLQELIAPANVMFYDTDWNQRGSKRDLEEEISAVTGIDRGILNGTTPLSSISIAKRMSWAAYRETSRIEDLAYSLLGVFDVNMPMIYGEGAKSFIRLQEEILKKTTDLSLFAWQGAETAGRGILADSVSEFRECGDVVLNEDQFRFRDEISMTNKGVKINAALQYQYDGIYVLDLHCYRAGEMSKSIGIYLRRALDKFIRHAPQMTAAVEFDPRSLARPIYLESAADAASISLAINDDKSRRIYIEFPQNKHPYLIQDIRAVPDTYWHPNEQYFSIQGLSSFRGFVRFSIITHFPPSEVNGRPVGDDSLYSSDWILVCDLESSKLWASLYHETGMRDSQPPTGFIDPFKSIEQYGPLGDPFSLAVLCPQGEQHSNVSFSHGSDLRHDYNVTAAQDTSAPSPPYRVPIAVHPHATALQPPQPPQTVASGSGTGRAMKRRIDAPAEHTSFPDSASDAGASSSTAPGPSGTKLSFFSRLTNKDTNAKK